MSAEIEKLPKLYKTSSLLQWGRARMSAEIKFILTKTEKS